MLHASLAYRAIFQVEQEIIRVEHFLRVVHPKNWLASDTFGKVCCQDLNKHWNISCELMWFILLVSEW